MLQKIKNVILMAATLMVGTSSLLGLAVATSVPVFAAGTGTTNGIEQNLCKGAGTASGAGANDTSCSSNNFSLSGIATSAVNIFSWVVGIVAVIMIIVGGFRYISSGGSSDKVGSAKNTLIYAIVGLIIVALAQFIVHFVVQTANNGSIDNS